MVSYFYHFHFGAMVLFESTYLLPLLLLPSSDCFGITDHDLCVEQAKSEVQESLTRKSALQANLWSHLKRVIAPLHFLVLAWQAVSFCVYYISV